MQSREENSMKHKMPKRPTREQKKLIEVAGLRWENWLVVEKDNLTLTIINKQSRKRRAILI